MYNYSTNSNTYHTNVSNSNIVNNIMNNNKDNIKDYNSQNSNIKTITIIKNNHQKNLSKNNIFNKSHKKNLTNLEDLNNINNNKIDNREKKIINSKNKNIPLKYLSIYFNNLNRQKSYSLLRKNYFSLNNIEDNKQHFKKSNSKKKITTINNLIKEKKNNEINKNSIKDYLIKKYVIFIQKIIRGYLFRKNNYYRMKLKLKEIPSKNNNTLKVKKIIDTITKIKYKNKRVQTPINTRTNTSNIILDISNNKNYSFINNNNKNNNNTLNEKSLSKKHSKSYKKLKVYENELKII